MKEEHEKNFLKGIEEFNNRLFFESHDTIEEVWMETTGFDRLFLQGLIQVSVGFYHFSNQNYKGAVSQFSKGLSKLEPYMPSHGGVELEQFTTKVREWLRIAEQLKAGVMAQFDLKDIPAIKFVND